MPEKKEKIESVKVYQKDIAAEKQKMAAFAKRMGTNVKSLQAAFKQHAKEMNEAAQALRDAGLKNMTQKVSKYKADIRAQIRENKDAASHMADNIKFFQGQIDKKKKDYAAYLRGPFKDYIKSFWG